MNDETNEIAKECRKIREELEQQLKDLDQEIEKLQNSLNITLTRCEDRDQEISKLKAEIERWKHRYDRDVKSLEQENDRLTNRNNQLEDFCQEFVYGEENPEYYKIMGEKLKDREEMIRKAIPWITYSVLPSYLAVNQRIWGKATEEIKEWLEKAKRLTGEIK